MEIFAAKAWKISTYIYWIIKLNVLSCCFANKLKSFCLQFEYLGNNRKKSCEDISINNYIYINSSVMNLLNRDFDNLVFSLNMHYVISLKIIFRKKKKLKTEFLRNKLEFHHIHRHCSLNRSEFLNMLFFSVSQTKIKLNLKGLNTSYCWKKYRLKSC